MKKLLLTLCVSIALCGTLFAQYESHWSFNPGPFEMQSGIVAAIMIDGQIIDQNYNNWDALEVAAFVGEGDNEECRGNQMYLYNGYVEEYDDPFPVLDGNPIYYMISSTGDAVHFKMYDHEGGIEYTDCTILYLGDELPIRTGEDHLEGWSDPENPIFLSFISSGPTPMTMTLEIDPYVEERDNYYLIASPYGSVQANMVEGLRTPAFDFYRFDQNGDGEGNEWINLRDEEEFELQSGVGFLYANNMGTDLVFSGTPLQGDAFEIDLDYSTGTGVYWQGWNLVGNPFDVTVYPNRPFYTMTTENDQSVFVSHDANDELPAMYGAFVQADGENQKVTMHKTPANKSSRLDLNLSHNRGLVDRAIVSFGEGQQLSKFMFRENSTKVYIPMEGKDYAVVSAEGMGEMPVNFKAEKSGSYTISAKGEGVSFTYLHLIDNMTGSDIDLLATPSYSFNASTTDYESRFRLVFATGDSMDGDTFGFVNGAGNLSIYGIEGEATLQVMDVNGRVLSTETFSGSYEKSLNVAAGIYVLRLTNGDNVRVQKMIVK